MNKFTQKVMGTVVSDIAEALHGVDPDWERIVVEVAKEDEDPSE